MSHTGVCHECTKRFKIPHLNKEWNCKSCGGPLQIEDSVDLKKAEPETQSGLDKSPLRQTPRKSERTNPFAPGPSASDERSLARRSRDGGGNPEVIRRATRIHNGFGLFRVLVYFALFWSALSLIGYSIRWANGTYQSNVETPFFVAEILVAAFLVGALRSLRNLHGNPLPYAIVLLLLYLSVGAMLSIAGVHVVAAIMFLLSALYGYFARMAWQMIVLRREHPDAFDTYDYRKHDLRDRARNPRSRGSARMEARQSSNRRQSSHTKSRFGMILAGVFAAILIGIKSYTIFNAPDNVASVVGEFHDAWNAGDFPGLASLSAPGRESKWLERFERQNENRHWDGQPPTADKGEFTEPKGDAVWVTYRTAKGPFKVLFARHGKQWWFERMSYRELEK